MNKNDNGILYIVPTPIGNLLDITYRSLEILKKVDIIAAENIQHTKILLNYFNITNYLISMNKHNEKKQSNFIIKQLKNRKNIAIVSNAGTPIINDPGYFLVTQCRLHNIKIIPLPGACAAITALIASGISANRFCYEGFIPVKKKERCDLFQSLKKEKRTIIFYESKHRILTSIKDIIEQIDANRNIVIAKEITKKWEAIYYKTAINMFEWMKNNSQHYKGEMVIIIEGFKSIKKNNVSTEEINTFNILNPILKLKEAVSITSQIHKTNKNNLYKYAIKKEEK
ncbi:16S rRNA (cytidine(1402)-2'-O)-methyltransferase [Buchnera aphidicola]|uniref:16S rRNA (cytidine(1402)-2'-O)-methyltransferase n=1 Tax=Buchnera aphidicola TaxID=9 RepID=UPI003BEF4B71